MLKLFCACGNFEFNTKKEYQEHIDNGIHDLETRNKNNSENNGGDLK